MDIKLFLQKYKKEGIAGGVGALVIIIFVLLVFCLPRPTLIEPPASTKEATVMLKGKAKPQTAVAVFNDKGPALLIVNTNDQGEFEIQGLPLTQGSNTFELRSLVSAWRISLPTTVVIMRDAVAPFLEMAKLNKATVTGSSTIISGQAEPGATVTTSTTSVSPGSEPAPRPGTTTGPTGTGTTSGTATGTTPAPAAPEPVLAIVANAWVSNPAPPAHFPSIISAIS